MSSQSPTGPPSETPSAPTHEKTTTPGTPSPRPEMMFGLWTSWVEVHFEAGERHENGSRGLAWTGCMADVARSAH